MLCKTFTFPNSMEGFNHLYAKINSLSDDLSKLKVGLEATGHYSYNLLGFLLDKGLPAFVINPLHTNLYRNCLFYRSVNRMVLCNCHISSSLSLSSATSSLYIFPVEFNFFAIWLIFRPIACSCLFIFFISVSSRYITYPLIAIFLKYAPILVAWSCFILSSIKFRSSCVTGHLSTIFRFLLAIRHHLTFYLKIRVWDYPKIRECSHTRFACWFAGWFAGFSKISFSHILVTREMLKKCVFCLFILEKICCFIEFINTL